MAYGEIEYNSEGKPKCELCNKFFHRVLSHVRQKHFLTEKEYKQKFGFDLYKGITSNESKLKSREAVFKNYEIVVKKNLLEHGKKERFKKGCTGRTKEKVSQETKNRLKNRLKTDFMKKAMKTNGQLLGLSGKGNETRWGKK